MGLRQFSSVASDAHPLLSTPLCPILLDYRKGNGPNAKDYPILSFHFCCNDTIEDDPILPFRFLLL
jgi:hypothetical protein